MASQETLSYISAGAVNIDSVVIASSNGFYLDITDLVIGINWYEGLDRMFIEGTLAISDSIDLANIVPLTGEEYVNIKVTTPGIEGISFNKDFFLYRMSDRTMASDKNIIYNLHFVSVEAMYSQNKKFSQAYSGAISQIAEQVIVDGFQYTGKYLIEQGTVNTKFIANYWSPERIMDYLQRHEVNTNGSPYTTFENRNGLNFVSYDYMIQNEEYTTFIYDKYIRDTTNTGSYNNTAEAYKRISRIQIPKAYDYFERLNSGYYGSRQLNFDIYTKKFTVTDFDSYNVFTDSSRNKLNKNNPVNINGLGMYYAQTFPMYMSSNTFTNYENISNNTTIQKQKTLLEIMKSNSIIIEVSGRVDYTAGQVVNVVLPKIAPLSGATTEWVDTRWSGKYLINAISHNITIKDGHVCTIELISDSIITDPDTSHSSGV